MNDQERKDQVLSLLRSTGLPVVIAKEEKHRAEGTIDGLPFKASWKEGAYGNTRLWLRIGNCQAVTGGIRLPSTQHFRHWVEDEKRKAEEAAQIKAAEARRAGIQHELLDALVLVEAHVPPPFTALLRRAVEHAIENRFLGAEDSRRQAVPEGS